MKKRTIKFITCILLAVFAVSINILPNNINDIFKPISNSKSVTEKDLHITVCENRLSDIRGLLIEEVNKHINYIAPKSNLTGKAVVDKCLKHNIDIVFVLAQGQIESHYGTTGIASKTNSVFNIGAYDGRSVSSIKRNGNRFKHPDESVEPYIIVLKNDYLVNGKSVRNLMKNYVNKSGYRYASSTNYEQYISSVYNNINNKTNITKLTKEYNHHNKLLFQWKNGYSNDGA